jgi:uroporphyrinogen decarboxylase
MTSRERVLAAMRRETPDRPPLHIACTSTRYDMLKEELGINDIQEVFPSDVGSLGYKAPPTEADYTHWFKGRTLSPDARMDKWGVAHEPGSLYHFTHRVSPLAGKPAEALADYELPDRTNPACFDGLADAVAEIHDSGVAVMGGPGHTYEIAWAIRGLDEFLMDMSMNPDPIDDFLERIFQQNCILTREMAKAGADIMIFGDDVANQNAMMFSPEQWRHFFKDRLRQQIAIAKEVNPDILTWYHSDGNISAIIPELIEIGLDILNPVQPECLDLKMVKEQYGDQLAFWGAIGTQTTMPFGTPDEVRKTTIETIETLGPGLLVAPTHVLEPEVTLENIRALYETVIEYRY